MEINLGKLAFDIDFHPSDNLVAAGLITGHLHLLLEVHAHTESCRAARFINSGRALLTGSSDCSILATDVETGSTIARVDNAHESAVNRLINLTESTVVSGDNDGCIKNGRKVVCGSQTGIILLYSWGCFKDCSDQFTDLSSNSIDAMLKLNEDRIITGSENRIINLVGILPNRVIQPIAEHSEYPVEGLAFSHDRKFLGSIAYDQMLKIFLLCSYGTWIIYCKVQETKTNSSGVIDSDDDEMDLDGNKRNNGHAVGCSNKFFVDL
ncbi:WD repeat-containing protein 55 [Glycine soja]|uniref:WD repeat-containing protein 55 n=1 Tax=Glycine soja TaxID=3848 RepID=A0A0B2RJ13_GLYSO|nr:WD repeat-containing protein 55 [Glycine soja]